MTIGMNQYLQRLETTGSTCNEDKARTFVGGIWQSCARSALLSSPKGHARLDPKIFGSLLIIDWYLHM